MRNFLVIFFSVALGVMVNADVVDEIKERVNDKWEKLDDLSTDLADKKVAMDNLPETKRKWQVYKTTKDEQYAKVRKLAWKIRKILITETSADIMDDVSDVDEDILEVKAEIEQLKVKRETTPGKEEKFDRKIEDKKQKLAALEKKKDEEIVKVCSQMARLGFKMDPAKAKVCLFSVNSHDVLDNLILLRTTAEVVEKLGKLLADGNMSAAKRYYGMYLAMVEVQICCFDSYIEKSRNSSWRADIEKIRTEAFANMKKAEELSTNSELPLALREHARQNVSSYNALVMASIGYLKVLDYYETLMEKKKKDADLLRQVVENTYIKVSLEGGLISTMMSHQKAFDELFNFALPKLEGFDDSSVVDQFQSITHQLLDHK